MVFGEDVKIGFKFLIYLFQFTVSLGVVGGGEGNVVLVNCGPWSEMTQL